MSHITISQQMLAMVLWIIKYTIKVFFCRFLIYRGIKISQVVQKLQQLLIDLCKDYFTLRHLGNRILTWESLQIFSRRPQTPDKEIRTLCGKCYTQEVFDGLISREDRRELNMCVSKFTCRACRTHGWHPGRPKCRGGPLTLGAVKHQCLRF